MAESNAAGGKVSIVSDKCFSVNHSQSQSAAAMITPTSGKKLIIRQVYASTSTINADVTLEFLTSEKIIFKLYTAQTATSVGNIICGEGAVDEVLSLTCGANTFVSVSYDEE